MGVSLGLRTQDSIGLRPATPAQKKFLEIHQSGYWGSRNQQALWNTRTYAEGFFGALEGDCPVGQEARQRHEHRPSPRQPRSRRVHLGIQPHPAPVLAQADGGHQAPVSRASHTLCSSPRTRRHWRSRSPPKSIRHHPGSRRCWRMTCQTNRLFAFDRSALAGQRCCRARWALRSRIRAW